MWSRSRFIIYLFLSFLFFLSSHSFIYKIYPNSPTTSLSSNLLYERIERVYGTNNGPAYGKDGDTYIQLLLHLTPSSFKNNTELIIFSFSTENWDDLLDLQAHLGFMPCLQENDSLFQNNKIKEHTAQRYILNRQPVNMSYPNGTYDVVLAPLENRIESNGTFQMYMKINHTSWVDTQVVCCSAYEESTTLPMNGEFIVHNPYGYLPSILYGLLPFTGLLALVYGLVTIIYLWLLYVYRKSSMFLQYNCVVLLALGTLSTLLHFLSLLIMNSNGNPICCPFDKILLASIIFNSLMRTFARLLLLIVCIGYGVIVSRLPKMKQVMLGLLTFAYFISSLFDEILLNSNDCNLSVTEIRGAHTGWSFAELVCNLAFVTWIYAALEDIIKRLALEKQTSKLRMYQLLAKSLGVFIGFFSILTLLALGSHLGFLHWPVETQWVQLIVWPVMNILVAITISFLWRPCQGSNQYAFSMQLPSTESQVDDDDVDTDKDNSTNALVTEDEELKFSIDDLDNIQDSVSPRRRHLSPEAKKKVDSHNIQEVEEKST